MYCARSGDVANGVAAAVNAKFAKRYEAKCTDAEMRVCATAGACADTGSALARCRNQKCVFEYEPRL